MSFNRLPAEIKQLIVNQAAYSDAAHRSHAEEADSDSDSDSTVAFQHDGERGRSVQTLSKVSTEIRTLCCPHLFSVLRVSQCQQKIFQHRMLESSIRNYLTTLKIDPKADLESLSFALFHVCPRLPNLDSVTFTGKIWDKLLGFKVRASDNEARRETLKKFAQLASRVRSWNLEYDNPHQIITCLFTNPAIVCSLTISALLLVETSPSLTLLAWLSTLRHLTLSFDGSLPTGACVIPTSALDIHYYFRDTLCSLKFVINSKKEVQEDFDVTLLEFASLFPSLRLLHVDFNTTPIFIEISPISLPQLAKLEIRCHDQSSASEILRRLDLPRLVYLQLEFDQSHDLPYKSLLSAEMDELVERITELSDSLKVLYVKHPIGMYKRVWSQLVKDLEPHGIQIRKNWSDGGAETEMFSTPLNQEEEQFVQLPEVLGEVIVELGNRVAEKGQRLAGEGKVGEMRQMLSQLRGIRTMEEWQNE